MGKWQLYLLDAVGHHVLEMTDGPCPRRPERGVHEPPRDAQAQLGKDGVGADVRVDGGDREEQVLDDMREGGNRNPRKDQRPGDVPVCGSRGHHVDDAVCRIVGNEAHEHTGNGEQSREHHAPPTMRRVAE